jgi:hypothetical protein
MLLWGETSENINLEKLKEENRKEEYWEAVLLSYLHKRSTDIGKHIKFSFAHTPTLATHEEPALPYVKLQVINMINKWAINEELK